MVTSIRWLAGAAIVTLLMIVWVAPSQAADNKKKQAEKKVEKKERKKDHPLDSVLPWAEELYADSDHIKGYTAQLVKRERIGGKLKKHEFCSVKIRHKPFSVYLKFLAPKNLKGRETIYVAGKNNGLMLAHESGFVGTVLGTVKLKPKGVIAMQGQRHPITEIGFKNLASRLLEDGKRNRELPINCVVDEFKDVKVDERVTDGLTVTFTERHKDLRIHMARIYMDRELKIPVRYEGYDWPAEPGGKPLLVGEYTYRNVKLNPGLTDADFDPKNPAYDFP